MLSRLFEDIGQIGGITKCMLYISISGCSYLDSYNVIFEGVMASDFVGATWNGFAAQRYLLMVADMSGTGNGLPQM